ncbi:MAG: anhydro-N-acetylmuramic acid kinase [Gemmatimonadota bacterium]
MTTRVLIGLMSGTSLDGVSAAAVRFSESRGRLALELLAFDVTQYDQAQRARLARALTAGTPEEYCRINFDLGEWLAAAARGVMNRAGLTTADVSAIASHGQTVWHVPGHSTWQTGEPAVIAERTGLPVISNFRVADMAAGGQGAPLVPIADSMLFAADDHWRALQNIGGIGNVSVVPPRTAAGSVRAFDTGPGVVVLDGVVRALRPDLAFDRDGRLAASGAPIDQVVERCLDDPYFAAPPPKSTGRELFSPRWIEGFMDSCRAARSGATTGDILATAVELTAASIEDAFRRFLPEPVTELVLSGGGAHNPVLVAAIRRRLAPRNVVLFDDLFFDGEAKEAVAFALMGWLHLEGRPGNVPTATGASGPRLLGSYTPAPNSWEQVV